VAYRRLYAVRVFYHDAHCVQYAAADDEGENIEIILLFNCQGVKSSLCSYKSFRSFDENF
jgi:hypothetical protein